jgi:copper resistance protein B
MNRKIALLAAAFAFVWTPFLSAQENQAPPDNHAEHGEHSETMDHAPPEGERPAAEPDGSAVSSPTDRHPDLNEEAMPAMDHSRHGMPQLPAGKSEDRVEPTAVADEEGGPVHGSTSMQGGSPPPDARDPAVYAEGYGFGPLPPPEMADKEYFNALLVDRLESLSTGSTTFMTYDFQYWWGKTFNRALIRAEGDIDDGAFQHARTELLWAHAADPNWDTHLGIRYDKGFGPDRGWLALGVQGIAPYWVYVEATAYVGEQGRTAFRLETEYDVLLTQKLVLQPRIEANFYGKKDPARALGHGLSDLAVGLRLRYEIWRELAPYIGIEWAGRFGDTADYLRNAGNRTDEIRAVAGIQFWY